MLHPCSTQSEMDTVESIADFLLATNDWNVQETIQRIQSCEHQNPKEILLFYTNVLSERHDLPIEVIIELSNIILKAIPRLNVKKQSNFLKSTYPVLSRIANVGLSQECLFHWMNQVQDLMIPEMDWKDEEDRLQWINHVQFLLKIVELLGEESEKLPFTPSISMDTLFQSIGPFHLHADLTTDHWPQKGLILLLSYYCHHDLTASERSYFSRTYSTEWLTSNLIPLALNGLKMGIKTSLYMIEYLWSLLTVQSLTTKDLLDLPHSNYCYMEIFEQLLHWMAFPDSPETQRRVYHHLRLFITRLDSDGLYALFHYLLQAQKEPQKHYRLAANTLLTNTLKQCLPMDLKDLWFKIKDSCWTLPKDKTLNDPEMETLLSEDELQIYSHSSWICNNLNLFLLIQRLVQQDRLSLPIDLEAVKLDWIHPMIPHCQSMLKKLADTPQAFQIELLVMSIHQIY